MTFAPKALPSWIAVTPIRSCRPAPAGSRGVQPSASKTLLQTVKKVSGRLAASMS